MDFLVAVLLMYILGYLVSGFVTMRRGQQAIRRRVEGRGGRPIEDVEAWSRFAWVGIKSVLWPLNLGVWLWLGKPEPGSYRRVPAGVPETEPRPTAAPATATPRPMAPPTYPAAPVFPTGPGSTGFPPAPGPRHGQDVRHPGRS